MSRWSTTTQEPPTGAWAHGHTDTRHARMADGTRASYAVHHRPKHLMAGDGDRHPVLAGTTMVASAALVSKEQVRTVMGRGGEWQRQVWDLYDEVPELRFGISWTANACSRARLYVGKIDPDGSSDPVPLGITSDDLPATARNAPAGDGDRPDPAMAAKIRTLLAPLNELAGGHTGRAEMLKRLAILLNVPGESYLIGFDDPENGQRRWLTCSPDEVRAFGAHVRILSPDIPGAEITVPIASSTILRIWRPHPRLAHDADSSLRALRGVLRELLDLSAHIAASAESRLAGAGVLFVPSELAIPGPEQSEDGPNPLHSDPFTASLIEAMAAPLKNRDSASAVVPLVVRGPAEAGKEMKHLSFATPFDERVSGMRDQAIRRVATGLDIPAEILTGMGDSNHWSAWQVEEGAIKLHIEPLLGLICDSLTSQFYQPALKAMGVPDWDRYAIWYDTSSLALRPNRTPEANDAFARDAISETAYRRVLGFSDEDAPSKEERAAKLARQLAVTNANLAPFLAPRLGIPLTEAQQQQADPDGTPAPLGAPENTTVKPRPAPGPAAPAPSGGRAGRNMIPRQPQAAAIEAQQQTAEAWRISCLDMAVRRALSRVGQHLIRSTPRSRRVELQRMPREAVHAEVAVDSEQVDQMLAGAYAEFIESTPNEPCLHRAVDTYVRALLASGQEHRVEYLPGAIRQFGCE